MGLPNVEVGPKVKEDARRQLVDELRARWEMEDAHLAERHALPNEVQVDLHVFCTLVLDRVSGHVHRTHIVTIDNSGTRRGLMKLAKELSQPDVFSDGVRDGAVLGLHART